MFIPACRCVPIIILSKKSRQIISIGCFLSRWFIIKMPKALSLITVDDALVAHIGTIGAYRQNLLIQNFSDLKCN